MEGSKKVFNPTLVLDLQVLPQNKESNSKRSLMVGLGVYACPWIY